MPEPEPRRLAARLLGRDDHPGRQRPVRAAAARTGQAVKRWLAAEDGARVRFATIGEAGLRHGVANLPAGKRRNVLALAFAALLEEGFRGRILAFDRAVARACAAIAAARRAVGRPISRSDGRMAGWPDGPHARGPGGDPQPERRHGLRHRAGWDAIRKDIDEYIAAAPGAEFTFATVSVHVLGTDLAVATAPFTVTLPVDGKPAQLKGAASMVVRRSAGQLLIVHDHYSLQHE
ncbi:MAG: nuclear transport factor 2 family protein [Pseudomonadota bacterium]|nr:nuclear transport factor 2 family protein [Rubrivivax sp.]